MIYFRENWNLSFVFEVNFIHNFSGPRNLENFYIDVNNNADGSFPQNCAFEDRTFGSSETRVYTCRNPLKGRYVRIRGLPSIVQYLGLCEVQVQGNKKFSFFYLYSENYSTLSLNIRQRFFCEIIADNFFKTR